MEQLQITQLGSVKIEPVPIEDKLDIDFKPGLFRQTEAFLNKDTMYFCALEEQVEHTKMYSKMAGYHCNHEKNT